MVDVKGAYKVTAKGRVYWYAWRGGPRIKAAPGTDAFLTELAGHRDGRKGGDPNRISGLCVEWKASDRWTLPREKGGYSDGVKRNWRRWVDEISTYFGSLRVSVFDLPEIRRTIKKWRNQWKDTPRAADMAKQVLSALLTYAVEEGKLATNPCFGIANLYASDRSEIIWTEDDVMQLAGHASPEIMYALGLACLTGLRQSDLLKLSWSHVGELAIEMRTGKSGEQKTAVIPMYAELKAFLAVIPVRSTRVLTNSDGHPWKTGFSSSWNKSVKPAGIDKHFHDARGSFVTWAYELGVFTIKELAELVAWSEDKVERIINRYVRRDALLRDKIRRMDEARKNTQ